MGAIENQLIDLEKKYWRAMKEGDIDTCVELTSFPCLVTGPMGVKSFDQSQFEEVMRRPTQTIQRAELGNDIQARLLSEDVGMVAYKVHEEMTIGGKSVILDAIDSSTWVRHDGTWSCAAHTEAIAGDAFGRDRQMQT